jgi:large subunit ribosomal protein L10
MAKSKEQKKEILQTLEKKINDSKSIVFTSFDALNVVEGEELRKNLHKEDGEYYVAKKTLLHKVFSEKKIDNLDIKNFVGKIAVIFSYDDEVAGAKIIANFQKKHENKITFVGGILENKFLNSDEINNLSKLPSKIELYAKITGSLNAPISGFVNCLSGNLRKLVYALNAIKEAKASLI